MLPADVLDARVLVEVAHPVAAEQREVVRSREPVPQYLDLNRRDVAALVPEHVHHPAVCADSGERLAVYSVDRGRDGVLEAVSVRAAVDHEVGQDFFDVEHRQRTGRLERVHVEFARAQLSNYSLRVTRCGNHEGRPANGEALAEETRNDSAERRLALVKPHRMKVVGLFSQLQPYEQIR